LAENEYAQVGPVPRAHAIPWWVRAVVYCFTWLPVFVLLVSFVPRFLPIFKRLFEQGGLPRLSMALLAFAQMDAAFYHIPAPYCR